MVTKEQLEEELGREPIEESEEFEDVPEDTRSRDAEETPLSAAADDDDDRDRDDDDDDDVLSQEEQEVIDTMDEPAGQPPEDDDRVTAGTGSEPGEEDFPDDYEFPDDDDTVDTTTQPEPTPDSVEERDSDQPLDPTDPASPGGTAVTGTEARLVAEGEIDVRNLEDRPALVSALSGLGFPDIRGSGIPSDLDRAIDQGLVTVGIEGGRLETELTEQGFRQRAEAQEIRQARMAAEEGEIAVSIEDLSAEERTEIGQQFESQLEEQLGFDVDPGRDFTLTIEEQTEQGVIVGAEFTDTFRERREDVITEQAEADIETAVGRSRLSRFGFGDQFAAIPGTTGTVQGGQRVTAETARQFADLELGEDFFVDVEQTGGGVAVTAGLTEAFEEAETLRAAEAAFESQTGIALDRETDLDFQDGGVGLSEQGQETVERELERRAGDEFEREVLDIPVPSAVAPFIGSGERQTPGPIPGFTRVPLGTLPGVSERDATLEDIISGSLDVLGEEADRQAEDFAFTRGVSPLAAGATIGRPGTLPTGREADPGVDSPAQEQAERFLEGGGALIGAPVSIAGGLEELREFGLETVERAPRQPLPETGEFVAEESIETGEQTLSELADLVASPGGRAELAGSLAFSAGVFGAARAVGPRTSFATRAAIQPGEEALGIGGFAATRRVAGRGTAQRFFPNREPLIFSEEAAILGARRGARSARRGVERIRAELGRTEVNVRARPGVGAGGLAIEIERAEVEAEEEVGELGPELEPFDVSDTRLFDPARTFGETEPIERFIDEPTGELPQDIEPGIGPRGEAGGFRGGTVEENFEAFLEQERARAEAAQRPFLEAQARRRGETAIALTQQETPVLEFGSRAIEGLELGVDQRFGTESFVEVFSEIGLESEQRFDTEFESELEQEFETEQEFELEIETELEQEFETEVEAEFETEQEFELEVEPFDFEFDFADEDGAGGLFEAFGVQRITEFGTVGGAVGVDVPGADGQEDGQAESEGGPLDDLDVDRVLGGPASETAFSMPFEGMDALDPGARTVTGLDSEGATPPGGELPASVSNAIFDERQNRPLF